MTGLWRAGYGGQSSPVKRLLPTFRLVFVLALVALPLSGRAQPADAVLEPEAAAEGEPATAEPATAEPATDTSPALPAEPDPLLQRARNIVALMEGTLDPSVDAADLLVVSLDDPALVGATGERLLAILRAAEASPEPAQPDPPAKGRKQKTPPQPSDTPPVVAPSLEGLEPTQALERAYGALLALSPAQRDALFVAHAEKRDAAQAEARAEAERAQRIERARQLADDLEAFLGGTLDVEKEPAPLLRLDLGASGELGSSAARRAAWLRSSAPPASDTPAGDAPPEAAAATDPQPPAIAEAAMTDVEGRLDGLRRRYLELAPEQRQALLDTHAARQKAAAEPAPEPEPEPTGEEIETAQMISDAEDEAQQAAAEREAALAAARRANTEAKRIVAEERARLLGVKEAQALYEADLNRRKTERDANHDKALEWSSRVGQLESSTKFESERAAEADPLYDGIREDLAMMRERLREELKRIRKAGGDVPVVGEGLDGDLPADVDREGITELREELLANEHTLTELEQTVSWELAQGLRDDVVLLNRTRLTLLDLATANLRSSVTGFGSEGVDQVKRELDQISVELGFHALKLPRYRKTIASSLSGSGIPIVIGLFQLAFAMAVFIWWRKRAHDVLDRAFVNFSEQQPPTKVSAGAATFVWYLQRVRRPLEVLAILWVVFAAIGNLDDLPEFNLLWIIALWVLLGLAVILYVDALAARETLYSADEHDTSELRIHSLRVVGLNVIAVGLILSLTSAMVGKGAIYSWVISTCWLLSFPVALYLIRRWRPIIFSRVEQRAEQNGFTTWVLANRTGVSSFAAATSAAVFLLGSGLASWVMRQLSGLEATRRLLAYLFRREVAKQAAATEADGRFTPIDPAIYAQFDPEAIPSDLLHEVAGAEIERVAKLAADPRATLSAIVGERGAGKSIFLNRIAEIVGSDKVRVLRCPEEGFDALSGELGKLVGDESLRDEALSDALRGLGPLVIAVDDLQRLVIPAVNGLRGLDQFTDFARSVGGQISWVVTIGSASWHYVRRARGERVFFEQVVQIPRWSEDDLSQLIVGHCARAKIEPSFDGLVVPRQTDAPLPNQGNRTEAGYYRLLWDFSKGNPAVALHAFRESLFVNERKETVVRLFKEPSPDQIEDLSMPVLFVLRAVVQLELAMPYEVEAATQLPAKDVDDAFRFCLSRGYLEPFHGGVRLSWPWYRTITTVLQRQHLLSTL